MSKWGVWNMKITYDTYHSMKKKSNLRMEYIGDRSLVDHEGDCLYDFVVAPIFNEKGEKISWGFSHDEYGLISEHKTKKEALAQLPDYDDDDDWEINNYGIDPELGGRYGVDFDDEVGFRD